MSAEKDMRANKTHVDADQCGKIIVNSNANKTHFQVNISLYYYYECREPAT